MTEHEIDVTIMKLKDKWILILHKVLLQLNNSIVAQRLSVSAFLGSWV